MDQGDHRQSSLKKQNINNKLQKRQTQSVTKREKERKALLTWTLSPKWLRIIEFINLLVAVEVIQEFKKMFWGSIKTYWGQLACVLLNVVRFGSRLVKAVFLLFSFRISIKQWFTYSQIRLSISSRFFLIVGKNPWIYPAFLFQFSWSIFFNTHPKQINVNWISSIRYTYVHWFVWDVYHHFYRPAVIEPTFMNKGKFQKSFLSKAD